MLITGFTLADEANPSITWIMEYADNTDDDRSDDTDGTAINNDLWYHMITAIYGMFVLGISSISSYIFAWTWLDIENGGANVECTL